MQPTLFGHYVLLHRLAISKMSEIYLARPSKPDAAQLLVVLKLLRAEAQNDPELVKMFVDEEAILGRLDHPNIIRSLDFGKAQDRYFIALEHVWGESLTSVGQLCVKRKLVFPLAAALHVGAEVAGALDHAHTCLDRAGLPSPIIHRDVTLNNVMLTYDGQVRVVDFGMAKAVGRLAETSVGQVKGTLAYLAPEQVTSGWIGPHTDIYQLGVVLYKLMVGRDPIAASGMTEFVEAILRGDIVPPSQVIGNFPRPVEHVLLKALALEPDQRYASASQLATALQQMLPEEFGDGREPITRFLQRVAGDRFHKQAAFMHQLAGIEGEEPDLDELFRRPSEDPESSQMLVECSAVMQLDGSLPDGLDHADELPWASAILMIEPVQDSEVNAGTEIPASVDELLNTPAGSRSFGEIWAQRLKLARQASLEASRRAGELAGPLVSRAYEVSRQATATGLEYGKLAASTGVDLGKQSMAHSWRVLRGVNWGRLRVWPARVTEWIRDLGRHPERLRSPGALLAYGVLAIVLLALLWPSSPDRSGGIPGLATRVEAVPDDRTPAPSEHIIATQPGARLEPPSAGDRSRVASGAVQDLVYAESSVGDARGTADLAVVLPPLVEPELAPETSTDRKPGRPVDTAKARAKGDRSASKKHPAFRRPRARDDKKDKEPRTVVEPTTPSDEGEAKLIQQLKTGRTCAERKRALERLGEIGNSERALVAVQEAGGRQPDNICMVFSVTFVEGKLRQRLGL
ncbi:MAG: serine/threonine-protein kinase [Pseudomonadota bacterium]